MNQRRRQFLKSLGITLPLLSGCQTLNSNSGEPTPEPESVATDTPTETPTATPMPDPEVFKVDFFYKDNPEKLERLKETSGDGFLEDHMIDTANSPIITNYTTDEEFDNLPIDLTAMQLHQKNNYLDSYPDD